jgi:hypothetical protein
MEQYEYVPMNVAYSNLGFGYGFGEGIGINASGGIRGHVIIHAYSSNQVHVSVFSDTAVRRLAPNSWRQATVSLIRGGQVLSTQVVKKNEPYIIDTRSRDLYLGSTTLTLPAPVDLTPVTVSITASSAGIFPEGIVPGKTQKATVSILVRKVIIP